MGSCSPIPPLKTMEEGINIFELTGGPRAPGKPGVPWAPEGPADPLAPLDPSRPGTPYRKKGNNKQMQR